MIVCVDVDYRETSVATACVGFVAWTDEVAAREHVVRSAEPPAAYEPGRFFERELPYLSVSDPDLGQTRGYTRPELARSMSIHAALDRRSSMKPTPGARVITITAFERSPDGGKGLARDTRVRWALEEVGQPYEVRPVSFKGLKEPAHLRLHPFGQIPTYEEGDLVLFETGAIVLHLAQHHPGLLPDAANARARAIAWMFAAVNTVEPPILELVTARIVEGDRPWAKERLPLVTQRIRDRLAPLAARLGDAEWLDGGFSAGDLMMVSVLLRLRPSGILDEVPSLAAYVARGEARPAYQRAFAAQLAQNTGTPPAS